MAEESHPYPYELAVEVAERAIAHGVTLATAESCTGGLIAHLLTRVAGVSAVFNGGIVAYANEAKRDLLGIEESVLLRHGAVSEPVALAMARGARRAFGVALAVSTTGVAGPGGGTPDKPVGLVYIAVSREAGDQCRRFRFAGDRAENIIQAAREALRLIHETLSTTAR
ncbi:MAG TPA: CinA family protein [Chloroflexota bacterium]|jgi:PncC family amidohydrolase|nr:CinA family protein [Chloroflexota bacterium]